METGTILIYFRITFIRNGVDWGYITLLWCLPFRCCLTHYSPKKALLFLSIIILLLAQSLQLIFNAFEGWGGPTPFINYVDFWTVNGFLRNLFFNGYHPFFPWFSFFLIGMIIGRLDLHNKKIRDRLLLLGITFTILIELLSKGLTYYFIPHISKATATFLFNTGPFYQMYCTFYLQQDLLLLY